MQAAADDLHPRRFRRFRVNAVGDLYVPHALYRCFRESEGLALRVKAAHDAGHMAFPVYADERYLRRLRRKHKTRALPVRAVGDFPVPGQKVDPLHAGSAARRGGSRKHRGNVGLRFRERFPAIYQAFPGAEKVDVPAEVEDAHIAVFFCCQPQCAALRPFYRIPGYILFDAGYPVCATLEVAHNKQVLPAHGTRPHPQNVPEAVKANRPRPKPQVVVVRDIKVFHFACRAHFQLRVSVPAFPQPQKPVNRKHFHV